MAYRYKPHSGDKWDYKKIGIFLGIVAVGAALLLFTYRTAEVQDIIPDGDYTPIALIGITEKTIVLGDRCNNFEIPITEDQLFSVRAGVAGGYVRPLTHDIYKSTIDHFGIQPIYFTLDKYDGDLWYATLRLRREFEVLDIEVRPSDGVGISVRYDLPIFIDTKTFESQAKHVC